MKRLPRWIRTRLPRDRAKRTLILAIVTSALFHLLFFVPFMTIPGFLQTPTYVKRRPGAPPAFIAYETARGVELADAEAAARARVALVRDE